MIIGNILRKGIIKKNNATDTILKSKRVVVSVIIFIMTIVVLSGIYLIFEWNRYQNKASDEAIMLAQSLKVFIPDEHITQLTGSAEDLEKLEYTSTKNDLMDLVETTKSIRFAYLLGEHNGNIIILLDSEPPGSPDYSPPGQIFEPSNQDYNESLKLGKTVLTKPCTDSWGTWISVFIPITDSTNGEIKAIFGMDYSASEWYLMLWKQMIPDIIIIICILFLSFALLYGWLEHKMNQTLSQKLSYSETLYRNIFEQAPVGIAIVNDKNFTYKSDYGHKNINKMFERILGRTSHELMNLKWTDITLPEDPNTNLDECEEFRNEKSNGYSLEKRYIKPDGSVVWTNTTVSKLSGLGHNYPMYLIVIEDISERKQAELALKESERKMAVLLSHLPGMAYRCFYDRDWTMQFVSEGSYNLTGYTPASLLGNRNLSFNEIISPEYRDLLWNEWENVLAKKLPFKYEYEIMTKNGDRKWVVEMGQGVYNNDGEVEALEGIILDITERKEMENNLRYINEHDRWTGLFNRDYLEALLESDAKKTKMQKRALIGINLSMVHLLTANYGFHYTQNLIRSASISLNQYCNDTCQLFKTYENRFVFYLKDYKDKSDLIEFSETIAHMLENLFVTDRTGGGIGIVEIDNNNELHVDLLLRKLLIASERAINIINSDFTHCFYNKELEDLVNREGDIRNELSRIASSDDIEELYLHYQPILDLKTDSVYSFEALARLRSEKLGFISPSEFITIAEETKLIIPVGEKLIIKAFSFLNRLKEYGFDTISISINISVIQLLNPEFTNRLLDIIDEMQVNPNNICIEITESIFFLDYENINNIISKLKDIGMHIAIDDFGTGYSSLARQKRLNVDYLKIDKYFIDRLIGAEPEKTITRDIISIAHSLGHCVIAEGVEYEEQKQYLIAHGCDEIQGYLIGRPLNEDDVLEFLKKSGK